MKFILAVPFLVLLIQLCLVGISLPLGNKEEDAPVSPLKFKAGQSLKYTYETDIVFSEPMQLKSARPNKDVGFFCTAEVRLMPLWSGEHDNLFEVLILKPRIQSISRLNVAKDFGSHSKFPMYFHIVNGRVFKIYTDSQDSTFAINLKKGLVGLFEVRRSDGISMEEDEQTVCTAEYKMENTTLIKTRSNCQNKVSTGQYSNVNKNLDIGLKSFRETVYDLQDGIIKSASSSELHVGKLNIQQSLELKASSRQKLQLVAADTSENKLGAASLASALESLTRERSLVETNLGSEAELRQCTEDCISLKDTVRSVHSDLVAEKTATTAANFAFLRVLTHARQSSKAAILNELADEKNEIILPQLIDVFTAAQTKPAQEALMEFINFQQESQTSLHERYLWAVAHCTHPSATLVENLLNLYKKGVSDQELLQSIALALGAVTYTYSHTVGQSGAEVVKEVEKTFTDKMIACKDEDCQLMNLRALGNAGLPGVVPGLLKVMEESKHHSVSLESVRVLRRMGSEVVTPHVKDVLTRMFNQEKHGYDSTVRTATLQLLLENHPTKKELSRILWTASDSYENEFSRYVQRKVLNMAEEDPYLKNLLNEVLSDVKLNTYHNFAQKGHSLSFHSLLSGSSLMNITFEMMLENARSGIMKQSGMLASVVTPVETLPLYGFRMFAQGLESIVGDEPEPGSDEMDALAGMQLDMLGVSFRPITFFKGGTAELMGAVWNAPTELTNALQLNVLLHDRSEKIRLQNGLVVELTALGTASIDLSGLISISLWNRNSHSLVQTSASVVIKGGMKVVTSSLRSGVEFTADMEAVLEFVTDSDFYDKPIKLCMQMMRPPFKYRTRYLKYEYCQGFEKGFRSRKSRVVQMGGVSYVLPPANSVQCRLLNTES